jgi:hypothetical protein
MQTKKISALKIGDVIVDGKSVTSVNEIEICQTSRHGSPYYHVNKTLCYWAEAWVTVR